MTTMQYAGPTVWDLPGLRAAGRISTLRRRGADPVQGGAGSGLVGDFAGDSDVTVATAPAVWSPDLRPRLLDVEALPDETSDLAHGRISGRIATF